MSRQPLDVLEDLLASDAGTIVACATPAGSLAKAKEILAVDETARRDFGTAPALARYVRGLAMMKASDARATLAEAAAIEAARPKLTACTLAAGLASNDAETRRQALLHVDTPAQALATAENLRNTDAAARRQFASAAALAAHLRTVAGLERQAEQPAVHTYAQNTAAAPAPASTVDDLTDDEIVRALGFTRGHSCGLIGALEQLHLCPRRVGTELRYPRGVIAERVNCQALADRIVRGLDRRLAAEIAARAVEHATVRT